MGGVRSETAGACKVRWSDDKGRSGADVIVGAACLFSDAKDTRGGGGGRISRAGA